MNGFEYKEVRAKDISNEHNQLCLDKLNKMGKDGWELLLISGGRAVFKRVLKKAEQLVELDKNRLLSELEEKQAYIYKKIVDSPEIKYISLRYENGDKVSLEIQDVLVKIRLVLSILQYKSKEVDAFVIPLCPNVKDYKEFKNEVLYIELMNPVEEMKVKSKEIKVDIEGVVGLKIEF